MSGFTNSLRIPLWMAAFGVAALAAPAALRAQTPTTPKVFYACYVPSSGTVYRIKEVDLKQECIKSTHVPFSWTDGAGHLSGVFNVESAVLSINQGAYGFATAHCPIGSYVVGGGYRIINYAGTKTPLVTYNAPLVSQYGWGVEINNNGDGGTLLLKSFARCAQ